MPPDSNTSISSTSRSNRAHARSTWLPLLLLVLASSLVGAFAWLSHHPDDPLLDIAEQWAPIQPWVHRFRVAYGSARAPLAANAVEELWLLEELEIGASLHNVGLEHPDPMTRVWVPKGSVLRAAPEHHAQQIHKVAAIHNLPRLERRDDWFQVLWQGLDVWVHVPGYADGYADDGAPPLGNAVAPVLPLPGRPPRPERLELALSLMGEHQTLRLGDAYVCHTDIDDPALLAHLDRVARQIEPLYRQRYGLAPVGEPQAVIVLYRQASDFRLLQLQTQGLGGLPAVGHTAEGLAALYLGDRQRHEMTSTLVHEIVHLINRRALGPALAPWLDEGLADDLAQLRIGTDGVVDPEALGGVRRHTERAIRLEGALSSLHNLNLDENTLRRPSIEALVHFDREGFLLTPDRRLHYDLSAMFVRFLLVGESVSGDQRYRSPFRAFLGDVARGVPLTPNLLQQHLQTPWPQLDQQLAQWLETTARQHLRSP